MLERTHHEGSMDHSTPFTPSKRSHAAMEPSLISCVSPITTPASSRRQRTLRTNTTSLIMFTALTICLSYRCHCIPHFISKLSRNRMLSNTNSRRGSSSTYEDHALCMHYDMQEISSGDKNHEHERQSHYTRIRMQKRRKRITIYRAVCTVQQEIGSRPSTLRNKR